MFKVQKKKWQLNWLSKQIFEANINNLRNVRWGASICLFCNTSSRLNGALYGIGGGAEGWDVGLYMVSGGGGGGAGGGIGGGGISRDWLTRLGTPTNPCAIADEDDVNFITVRCSILNPEILLFHLPVHPLKAPQWCYICLLRVIIIAKQCSIESIHTETRQQ